jgi:hypothetical protein
MNRRGFLALASGLLAPVPEPVRRYFFAPTGGWVPAARDVYRETILIDGSAYDYMEVGVVIGGRSFGPFDEVTVFRGEVEMREALGH